MNSPLWDRRDGPHRMARPDDRDDFGQADYSLDYGYGERERAGYRLEAAPDRDDDYGQADFSRDYAYDAGERGGYRRDVAADEPRSWRGRPAHPDRDTRHDRQRLAADRRILAIVTERLEHDRRIDSSDVEITVDQGVVYLTGTARTREGKRRIEHLVDVEGVDDVVNGLRIRETEARRGFFHF